MTWRGKYCTPTSHTPEENTVLPPPTHLPHTLFNVLRAKLMCCVRILYTLCNYKMSLYVVQDYFICCEVLIYCVRITYMFCNNYTTYQCCQIHVICCRTVFKDYDNMICCVRNLICCVKFDNVWIAMYFSDAHIPPHHFWQTYWP